MMTNYELFQTSMIITTKDDSYLKDPIFLSVVEDTTLGRLAARLSANVEFAVHSSTDVQVLQNPAIYEKMLHVRSLLKFLFVDRLVKCLPSTIVPIPRELVPEMPADGNITNFRSLAYQPENAHLLKEDFMKLFANSKLELFNFGIPLENLK